MGGDSKSMAITTCGNRLMQIECKGRQDQENISGFGHLALTAKMKVWFLYIEDNRNL